MNNKGQATLFIILGIVILFGVAIFLNIRSDQTDVTTQTEITATQVPVEFQPIRNFVDLCIIRTAEEGLRKLGQHGGYINPSGAGLSSNPAEPTESNSFRFFPQDENSEVAYWHYFKSDNECTQNCACDSEKPALEGEDSIQKQLENYVNENLANCIGDFKIFRSQGFDIKQQQPSTQVTFSERDTLVNVDYPLEIQQQDTKENMENFGVRIPLNFKRMYELASEITKAHQQFHFIEWWTQEQIDTFGLGVDKNKLPPTAASVFDPGADPVIWKKSDVRKLIQQNVIPIYTPFLQIIGTRNFEYKTEPFYERAYIPITSPSNTSYHNLEVNFENLGWWEIYFDITGRGVRGNTISPETASVPFFSFLGLQRYNYFYDVSYPVRVKISDPTALNRKGYDFYLGLESNIRNNKPLDCEVPDLQGVFGPASSLLCSSEQACANIILNVKDSLTGEDLTAFVSYGSAAEMCDAGKSNSLISLPQCIGPGCSLNVELDSYYNKPEAYSVLCSPSPSCEQESILCNGEELNLELDPLRVKNAFVQKKKMLKQIPGETGLEAWQLHLTPVNLLEGETVSIFMEKIIEDNEQPLIIVQEFKGQEVELTPGLVPGKYRVRIDLLYSLPDTQGRTQVIFKGDNNNIEDQIFDNDLFAEGISTFNLTITKEDLDSNELIIFYVISAPDASEFDNLDYNDLALIGTDLSTEYRAELEPQWQ